MDSQQARQDLFLIRDMIEKTRREAAESGLFFIVIGIVTFIAILAEYLLEALGMVYLVPPLLLALIVINGILAYGIISREKKREKVTTYTRTVYIRIWSACGLSILMAAYLFPLTHVYSWDLVPVLVSLLIGVAVFSTGVVFEERHIQWCGAGWWIAACIMAYSPSGMLKMAVMLTMIALGWVLPGLILRAGRQKRGAASGA